MRIAAVLALLAGFALLVGLVVSFDTEQVATLMVDAGPALVLVLIAHQVSVAANAIAWQRLLAGIAIPRPLWRLFWLRWLADSINALLPVASIGGEVVRGQLLARTGVGQAAAGGSVIADLTLGLVSLALFVVGGVVLFICRDLLLSTASTAALPTVALTGAGTAVLALVTLAVVAYRLQRGGFFLRLAHLLEHHAGGPAWQRMAGGARALDEALECLYGQRRAVVSGLAWRLAGWVLGAVEVWVALSVLGRPVTLVDALILESLGQVVRNAGFAVPGAIGIQEGGFVVIGGWIGLAPEAALAAGLMKRLRDLTLGIPALCLWQAGEGWLLIGCRRSPAASLPERGDA